MILLTNDSYIFTIAEGRKINDQGRFRVVILSMSV